MSKSAVGDTELSASSWCPSQHEDVAPSLDLADVSPANRHGASYGPIPSALWAERDLEVLGAIIFDSNDRRLSPGPVFDDRLRDSAGGSNRKRRLPLVNKSHPLKRVPI